jgi:hypothetical protein
MIQKRIISGTNSFNYLRNQLRMGSKTLSVSLDKLPLENGKLYSFVPKNVSEKALYDFENGGLYDLDENSQILTNSSLLVPIPNGARPVVKNSIIEYLKSSNENCCMMEEPSGQPSDPWVKKSNIEYVNIRDEMYYYFDSTNYNQDNLTEAFLTAEGYYFLCVLSALNKDDRDRLTSIKEIGSQIIQNVVNNVSSFFVSAYDHEGYLMWEKL